MLVWWEVLRFFLCSVHRNKDTYIHYPFRRSVIVEIISWLINYYETSVKNQCRTKNAQNSKDTTHRKHHNK